MKKMTFSLPVELAEWLKDYKHKHLVSLSAVVARLLSEWRAANDKQD